MVQDWLFCRGFMFVQVCLLYKYSCFNSMQTAVMEKFVSLLMPFLCSSLLQHGATEVCVVRERQAVAEEQRGDETQSQALIQKSRRRWVEKLGGVMNEEGALQPFLGRVGISHVMGRWSPLSNIQCGITTPSGTALLFCIYPAFTVDVNKQLAQPQRNGSVPCQPVLLWAAGKHGKGRQPCVWVGPRDVHPCTLATCTLLPEPCTPHLYTLPGLLQCLPLLPQDLMHRRQGQEEGRTWSLSASLLQFTLTGWCTWFVGYAGLWRQ